MTVLVTWLWQGLGIAFATAGLLACLRTVSAATRHAIWWIACAAVLGLPLAYAIRSPSPVAIAPAPSAIPLPAGPEWLPLFACVAWVVFAAAGLVRVGRSVVTVFRLKRTGQPLDAALAARLGAAPGAGSAGPELRRSDRAAGACALGLGRPVILLSASLIDRLDDEALAAIVVHERAHLERHDDWWQLLQAVVTALVGWHPAVWFVGRRIALEREAACDDHVLGRIGVARQYARALVEAAEARRAAVHGFDRAAIPGAASGLRHRIRRLLDPTLDRGTRPAFVVSLAGAAALTLAVAGAARVPPMVVFVEAVTRMPTVGAPSPRDWGVVLPRLALPSLDAVRPASAVQTRPLPALVPARAPEEPSDADGADQAAEPTAAVDLASAALVPPVSTGGPEPPPVLASRAPWDAFARSSTATAQALARSGVTTGDRLKRAGLSIGRFFSNTGKGVASRF